jgi:hypothetical protein
VKRFYGRIALLIPVPLLVLGFNFFVDPVHLVHPGRYEEGIARLVLQGKNVTNIWNPNEATYLRSYVTGLQSRKDVLIFGSSRSKLIRASSFPGLSFFNNSISGGSIYDYLAIYKIYREKGLVPSMVILELSPWILDRENLSIWKVFNEEKLDPGKGLSDSGKLAGDVARVGSSMPDNLSELVSVGYFQTSVFTWLRTLFIPAARENIYFSFRTGDIPVGETLLADGSAIYPERAQNSGEVQAVTAEAISYGENPKGIPKELDPERKRLLEALVKYLVNEGVKVVFYLPPYHPRTYAMLVNSERYRIIRDIQSYFEVVAHKNDISLIGSYNPADLKLSEMDFSDGSHPTEGALRSIIDGHIPGVPSPEVAVADAAPQIEIVGIKNENGLEVVDQKQFFWVGAGTTCLTVRSSDSGTALLTLQAVPGPSLPSTPERHLRVRNSRGYTNTETIDAYPSVTIAVPVIGGINEICLEPLDKPSVLRQSNGDHRPLLLGVSDARVGFAPKEVDRKSIGSCSFLLIDGWYPTELSGNGWLCWTDARGKLRVVSEKGGELIIRGEMVSAQSPNEVDVFLNGHKLATWDIRGEKFEFKQIDPIRIPAGEVQNLVEFVSHNPGISLPNDSRRLAIALKDIVVSGADGPCSCLQNP